MHARKAAAGQITVGLLAAILIISLFSGCNKDQILTSSWVSRPIIIDGKLEDWQGKPSTYFDEQQAVIALANDADNLYLHFRTKDAKWANLIKRTGLTIYVDNEGNKKKRFFVKLFDGPSMAAMRPRYESDSTRPQGDFTPMPRRGMGPDGETGEKRFTCFVEDRIIEMPIAPDGSMGPRAAYDTCWGFYSYEFAIPLQESAVRYYGVSAGAGQTISIGALWGEMSEASQPRRGEMGDRPDGGMPPGGGMPTGGGGMPGGGMPPGGGRPGADMPKKQEIWFKTTLASQAAVGQPANEKPERND